MREHRTWPVVLVAVAGVAVTVFTAYLLATWPPEPPSTATAARPATSASAASTSATDTAGADEPVLVVLGDEFSRPPAGPDGRAWPELLAEDLGWKVAVEAEDDTGFLHAEGGRPFRGRVEAVAEHEPDLVVVAGGENDIARHPADDITDAAADVVSEIEAAARDAEVVLASPFSKGDPGPLTAELTAALEQLAHDREIGFVDVSTWLEDSAQVYDVDPLHPNQQGHQRIAERMRAQLERLGIG